MLTPTIITGALNPNDAVTEYRVNDGDPADTEADLTVGVYEQTDGGDDVERWAESILHVQLDTTTENGPRGIVIHLNDGETPIYQGDPEQHDDAACVLSRVRDVLTRPGRGWGTRVAEALEIIRASDVIL